MQTDTIPPRVAPNAPSGLRRVFYCTGCGKPIISEPVLVCDTCGHELRLRCFSYRAGRNRYIAECIDLDILYEDDTREAAIGGLHEALYGYLSAVLDGQNTSGLLPRRAPLSHRLRYHFEAFKDRVTNIFDSQHTRSTIACSYKVRDGHLLHCE
jgi:hypothetical protein